MSGGVDSSVAAALIHRAIGKQLTCVFVDNGLLRLHEREQVEQLMAITSTSTCELLKSKLFLDRLKGVADPEKAQDHRQQFVEVFDQEVKKLKKKGDYAFLAQGTLYPDVIESVAIEGNQRTD